MKMAPISLLLSAGALSCLTTPASGFSHAPLPGTQPRLTQQLTNLQQQTICFPPNKHNNNINNNIATYSRSSIITSSSLHSTTSADNTNSIINNTKRLETLAKFANDALSSHANEIFKPFNARVAVMSSKMDSNDDGNNNDNNNIQQPFRRLGLIATESVSKADQTIAALPFYDSDGSGLALSPQMATKVVYKNLLPEGYDGWTGDVGLLAMLLLNEMARLNVDAESGGKKSSSPKGVKDLPNRKAPVQSLMEAYIATLPSYEEMVALHPLLWSEEDQEILQNSSTKKIYRLLDDIEDDAAWLEEKVWGLDRETFPESVTLQIGSEDDGWTEERPCFSLKGFRYAVAIVRSRSFFVDGALRLLPFMDFANHEDFDSFEISQGGIGTLWGSAKGAFVKSGKALKVGDEVKISYGPKGPAEYLLDHGFVPKMCQYDPKGSGIGSAITSELTFEVDDGDRFRDDKLDVLEFETYDLAPMEPVQSFDVVGGVGSTGEPDPAMIQFLRLVKLGGKDAFLLESIFRKEIWGFMSEPMSEENERGVVMAVIEACETALEEMEEESPDATRSRNQQLCAMVRESERQALERTLIYMKQEAEALDLKEYYQERRLKSLGLDSDWSPEDDDVGWGGTRVPGGADYDW